MSHLFRPNENTQMTFRRLVSLLKPVFVEDGPNERTYQKKVYNVFPKYLREAGSMYFQYILVNLKEKSNLKSLNFNRVKFKLKTKTAFRKVNSSRLCISLICFGAVCILTESVLLSFCYLKFPLSFLTEKEYMNK